MAKSHRILVVTLASGENELERCCESVRNQITLGGVRHEIISDLPSKPAHDALYNMIMGQASSFDLFIKLDGDMVFGRRDAIEYLVDNFRNNPSLDHLEVAVDDFFTGERVMGAHVYTGNAKWPGTEETLFVDPRPEICGDYNRIWDPPASLILHSPDPSSFQAFQYGFHRGLKIWQPERKYKSVGSSYYQFKGLRALFRNWRRTGDRRLLIALLGCEAVRADEVGVRVGDKNRKEVAHKFAQHRGDKSEIGLVQYVLYGTVLGWCGWVVNLGVVKVVIHITSRALSRVHDFARARSMVDP